MWKVPDQSRTAAFSSHSNTHMRHLTNLKTRLYTLMLISSSKTTQINLRTDGVIKTTIPSLSLVTHSMVFVKAFIKTERHLVDWKSSGGYFKIVMGSSDRFY